MRKTVVFVLSTNYAGSHFLSLMLGSHSRIVHMGEAKRLRKPKSSKPVCSLCDDAPCSMFDGVDHTNVDEIHARAFENLGDDVDVLVDSSKNPRWAARFVARTDYDVRFVHLIRDPRALMRRWALDRSPLDRAAQRLIWMKKAPSLAPRILISPQMRVYFYKWVSKQREITRFLARHGQRPHVVTYRDLARATGRTLERLVTWLGLPFEPAQIEYWNFEHHGSQKPEYEWVKRARTRHFDLRWREFLSEDDQRFAVEHPLLAECLAPLGVRVCDDGLTTGTPPTPEDRREVEVVTENAL